MSFERATVGCVPGEELEAMTDSDEYMQGGRAFVDPEGSAARLSAEPQSMYVDRAARCPVVRTGDNEATLLKMADILYVNRHRGVLQAADLLGSNRPAIPLSLDGPEHTKYRRLLDPVFTARRIAPLADSVRMLANELIDRFVDRGTADVYREWCEPLPGTVFIRILGLPLDDLPNFLRFKNMVLGNEFASLAIRRGDGTSRTTRSSGSSNTSIATSTSEWRAPTRVTTCSDGC